MPHQSDSDQSSIGKIYDCMSSQLKDTISALLQLTDAIVISKVSRQSGESQ
jgi:hypothetical protein